MSWLDAFLNLEVSDKIYFKSYLAYLYLISVITNITFNENVYFRSLMMTNDLSKAHPFNITK